MDSWIIWRGAEPADYLAENGSFTRAPHEAKTFETEDEAIARAARLKSAFHGHSLRVVKQLSVEHRRF